MCPLKDGKPYSLGPDGSILSDVVTLCHVTVTRRFVTGALSVMRPHKSVTGCQLSSHDHYFPNHRINGLKAFELRSIN